MSTSAIRKQVAQLLMLSMLAAPPGARESGGLAGLLAGGSQGVVCPPPYSPPCCREFDFTLSSRPGVLRFRRSISILKTTK